MQVASSSQRKKTKRVHHGLLPATTSSAGQSQVVESAEDGSVAVRITAPVQAKQHTLKRREKNKTRADHYDAPPRPATNLTVQAPIPNHHLHISRVQSATRHSDGQPISFGYIFHPSPPVPWAPCWPEAARFYTFNQPDYTGLGIYHVDSRYPESHLDLFKHSLRSFTIQILIAERARPEARLQRLMDLKGWFLHNLNQALGDSKQCASYSILSEVNALALYDVLYEEGGASTTHLHGLQLLLERYGGIEKLVQADFHMSNMVYFTDSIHSHFSNLPRLVQRRMEGTDIMDGIHHLRLALQPTQSNLSSLRLRSHLMMSFCSPAEFVFLELAALYKLADSTLGLPLRPSPEFIPAFAISAVQQMEARIYALSERPNDLSHAIFSHADRRNHQDTYELIRLSTLVLVQRFKVATCGMGDRVMMAHLDHAVQALFNHLLSKEACIRSTEAWCWALFVGTPFLDPAEILRKHAMSLVSKALIKLHLEHWIDVHAFLKGIFFSPPLQQEACMTLWKELQSDIIND